MQDSTSVHNLATLPYMPVCQTDSAYPTSLFDSVAVDTVAGIPRFIPVAEADSLHRVQEIADSIASIPPAGCEAGMIAGGRGNSYAHSTPLIALLAGVLVVLALKASWVCRALRSYRNELWSVRRRGNVFDDAGSVPWPMALLLALVYIVFGGIVLYNCPEPPAETSFTGAACAMGLVGAFYLFERCAYWAVGITFAGPDECHRWLGGFSATRAYSGLALIVPSLLMLFRPEWHKELLLVSLLIYFVAKILFIAKGFRIFYKGIVYLFYFILYFCTLEIIPLIVLYGIISGQLDITLY